MYRWIAYVWQELPGADGGLPERFKTLQEVKDYAEQYAMDMNTENIVGMLYPYTDENWTLAEEFRNIGNPFDYPTKMMEVGKRGAITLTNA